MKVISWNIDGANAIIRRRKDFRRILWMWEADIFAFQETKVTEPDMRLLFPAYHHYWSYHTTYTTSSPQSGTMCMCRIEPNSVYMGIGDDSFDTEGRIITLEFDHYYFINVYVPQSQDAVSGRNSMKSVKRREYRAKFDRLLRDYVTDLNKKKPVIMCGDFNASISSKDMCPNSRWQDSKKRFSKDANDQLRYLVKSGFTDSFRYLHPDEKEAYTHWHIKDKNRQDGTGRRLDYIFVSDELADKISFAAIHQNIKGSDHCPIQITIDMSEPVVRGDVIHNLTYEDLLQREKTRVYYSALNNVDLTRAWDTVDWEKAKKHLQSMQKDLVLACKSRNPDAIKIWQIKAARSLDAKLLAVRDIASSKGQAGIDGTKWETSDEKMHAALSLNSKHYRAKAARAVDKTDEKGKERRYHVDTYYDRAMQTLYGYTLAPIAETWADRKSFSCRKCRSTFDANYYICNIYSGEDAPKWAVKTDIHKCYESIDHDWIIKHIPLDETVLKEFLNAGYFLDDKYYESYEGIGIGSRLSPYLANMTMDGLQDYIYNCLNPKTPPSLVDYDNGNMVRFADDILISARSRDDAENIIEIVRSFMRERGLSLSEKKTEIIYVANSFDFLKRTYTKDGEYLNARPSETAVNIFKNKIAKYLSTYSGSQERLIEELNKKIIGFVNYHKMTDAMTIFKELDDYLNLQLIDLCKRKSPKNWSMDKIIDKYWLKDFNGHHVYAVKDSPEKHLMVMEDTILTKFYPQPLNLNPYLDYEKIDDLVKEHEIENVSGEYKKIWKRQDGCCAYCRGKIYPDDTKELAEVNPTESGMVGRMAYIHSRCRNLIIEHEDYKEPEYKVEDENKDLAVKLSDEYVIDDVQANPLYQFFKEAEKPTITLSFKKIGEILGSPLTEIAYERGFWFEDADDKLCRCWIDNNYFVKRVSTEGRKQVTFHKFQFAGDTGKVKIPDLLIHGEVPMRMKYEIESMLKHTFESYGLVWE